jgi:hypothetical protein
LKVAAGRIAAKGLEDQELTMADVAETSRTSLLIVAALAALAVAATIALWAHYGTAVFFEVIRAGFVACFG